MNRQQYSTPDGSIWTQGAEGPGYFDRIAGKDWDMDFRAQKLDEVLRSWGPLSLHDSEKVQVDVLTQAFEDATWFGCKLYIEQNGGPQLLFRTLDALGYEVSKKDEDD